MKLELKNNFYQLQFDAMASPCEVFFYDPKTKRAEKIALQICEEVERLEKKYSRYRKESEISKINANAGKKVEIDQETFQLLQFADTAFEISLKRFDITTGVLRQIWRDGILPSQEVIEDYKKKIGFKKIEWNKNYIRLPKEMEIDFGGIVKEYAADKVCLLLRSLVDSPILLNFGGDLSSDGKDNHVWHVGIEAVKQLGLAKQTIEFIKGGLATSGNTRRFYEVNGKRYGHILDPLTASPVVGAPLSVTVLASSCTEAGLLASLAMLKAENAETFLKKEGYTYWIQR